MSGDVSKATIRARFWWMIQLVTWPLYKIGITTPTGWALGKRWNAESHG